MKIALYLGYVSSLSVIPACFFYFRRKSNFSIRYLNMLGFVLVLSGISDLSTYILAKMHLNNLPVGNAYVVLQFFLLSILYSILLKGRRTLIYTLLFGFLCHFLIVTIFFEDIGSFQSSTRVTGALILFIYSIVFSFEIHHRHFITSLRHYTPYWINAGMTFYFGFGILLFGMSNWIFRAVGPESAMTFWAFHNVNNIVKNFVFAYSLCQAKTKWKAESAPAFLHAKCAVFLRMDEPEG